MFGAISLRMGVEAVGAKNILRKKVLKGKKRTKEVFIKHCFQEVGSQYGKQSRER